MIWIVLSHAAHLVRAGQWNAFLSKVMVRRRTAIGHAQE